MIAKAFALRDIKADAFGSPFFLPNENIAKRLLAEWAQDKRSEVGKYPNDFVMFEIGTFDNESGKLSPLVPPSMVCSVVSVLPKPEPDMFDRPSIEERVNG